MPQTEGLNVGYNCDLYSIDFEKPRQNSVSIASYKHSEPTQSNEALNIHKQQITLEST